MIRRPLAASAILTAVMTAGAAPALADAPRVVADIAPVHSLVARVMEGAGVPDLLLPPGASPHDFALRPSDARGLSDADLVIWTGEALTPWLHEPLETLAGGAELELLETGGWPVLTLEDHADDHDHDHGHDHGAGGIDPHAWLDPVVAGAWTGQIAEALAAADPENAALYRANAAAAQQELAGLLAEVEAVLAPVRGGSFVVPHDAYGYFERRFDMPAAGAITLTDAQSPGPARLRDLRARIAEEGIDCVLTDPQVSAEYSELIMEATPARTARVDALGGDLEAGADLYPETIRALARGLADCLSGD